MIFATKTSTSNSLLKKQADLQDQQDVSSTAFCSDSESSDTDCLVESISTDCLVESASLTVSSLKLLSSDSDQIVASTPPATAPPASKKKRRARFALAKSEIFHVPTLEEISKSEQADCWWGPKDFRAFRFSAKHSSYEARLEESNKSVHAVDDGYRTAIHLANTMQEHEMEQALAEDNVGEFTEGLKAWACRPASCRGLEHWTSKKHFQARLDTMEEAKTVVLQLAHFQESADEIAKHYQETSRPARILARLRGHADYEASADIVSQEEELAAAAQLIAY
jgi:hypothetical protein